MLSFPCVYAVKVTSTPFAKIFCFMPILQDAPANIHASLDIQTYKNRNPDMADKSLILNW
ncbi:hypothetical protein DMI60_07900 [Escherichia coli]|nr:hypothetical protein [Escherichia coli]